MATKTHKLFEHDDLVALVPGLWSVRGSLPFPLRRNMAVFRLGDGSLLLHSVLAMNEDGMTKLAALGRPSVLIVPNGMHRMDAPFYKARYPDLRVICPAAVRAKVEKVIAVDATCEEALPPLGVRVHTLPGFKTGELAYEVDVPGGKALLVADAVGSSDYAPGIIGGLMATLSGGIKGRLGVARIMKVLQVSDKKTAREGLTRLADVPGVRVLIPAHGKPILEDCAVALRQAAASL